MQQPRSNFSLDPDVKAKLQWLSDQDRRPMTTTLEILIEQEWAKRQAIIDSAKEDTNA